MKYTILALSILIVGCKSQLLTVGSDHVPKQNTTYIYEDDTVRITYNFWYNGGVVDMQVFNKLKVPLYIDWKNTAHIVNDAPYYYWQDVTKTTATGSSVSTVFGASGHSTGISVKSNRITAIPPQSKVGRRDFLICPAFKKFPTGVYTAQASPLRFREYIYLYTNEELSKGQHLIDNAFFISNAKMEKNSIIRKVAAADKFFFTPRYQQDTQFR